MIDHFFDDFFLVSVAQESKTASFCVKEVFGVLGFLLDPEKTQVPSEVSNVLGVVINTSSLTTQRSLLVGTKAHQEENLLFMIDRILELKELQPTVAASLVGKFRLPMFHHVWQSGKMLYKLHQSQAVLVVRRFFLSSEIIVSLK